MPSALKAPRILSYSFRAYVQHRGQSVYQATLSYPAPGQTTSPHTPTATNRNVYRSSNCFTLEVLTNSLPYTAVVRRWAARRVRVAIKKQADIESRTGLSRLTGHLIVHTFDPLIRASGEDVMNEAKSIIADCREKAGALPVNHIRALKQQR